MLTSLELFFFLIPKVDSLFSPRAGPWPTHITNASFGRNSPSRTNTTECDSFFIKILTIHFIIRLKFIWYISLFLPSKFYGAEIKFTPRKQQSSIPSKHKYGREMEILQTIPQHYFFFFGVIRNAQILWTLDLIRTQYLNSLLQM